MEDELLIVWYQFNGFLGSAVVPNEKVADVLVGILKDSLAVRSIVLYDTDDNGFASGKILSLNYTELKAYRKGKE